MYAWDLLSLDRVITHIRILFVEHGLGEGFLALLCLEGTLVNPLERS